MIWAWVLRNPKLVGGAALVLVMGIAIAVLWGTAEVQAARADAALQKLETREQVILQLRSSIGAQNAAIEDMAERGRRKERQVREAAEDAARIRGRYEAELARLRSAEPEVVLMATPCGDRFDMSDWLTGEWRRATAW